ncbi:MAG: ribonuclease HII [Victivallales bacterium]|nr:ribonuclease HII [Victivallales bacterium]
MNMQMRPQEIQHRQARALELYAFDQQVRRRDGGAMLVIAGIDEAGRGPLAGPVVVAGVILPSDNRFQPEVDDSKKLTERQRQDLATALRENPDVRIAIAIRSAADIDRLNILRATHEGMREVARALAPDLALVDGLRVPSFPVNAQFLVKGDARSASIAAASIIAKTTRDSYMQELDRQYTGYGFAEHKGYGTKAHLEALAALGPCPEHRMTFAPLRPPSEAAPRQLELPF